MRKTWKLKSQWLAIGQVLVKPLSIWKNRWPSFKCKKELRSCAVKIDEEIPVKNILFVISKF